MLSIWQIPMEGVLDKGNAIPDGPRSLAFFVATAIVIYIAVVPHRKIHQKRRVQATENTVEIV